MKRLALAALPLLASAPVLAQAPSDDPFTRTETKHHAEAIAMKIHARLDLNHDGYVTMDEIEQMSKQATGATADLSPPVLAFVRQLLLRGDTDHDGRLSLAEELAGTDAQFAEMDTNHDGKVTPEERRAAMMRSVDQIVPASTKSH